jgi:hypothetical protein
MYPFASCTSKNRKFMNFQPSCTHATPQKHPRQIYIARLLLKILKQLYGITTALAESGTCQIPGVARAQHCESCRPSRPSQCWYYIPEPRVGREAPVLFQFSPESSNTGASLRRSKETEIGSRNSSPEAPWLLNSRHYMDSRFQACPGTLGKLSLDSSRGNAFSYFGCTTLDWPILGHIF